jgi:hypothetical protein
VFDCSTLHFCRYVLQQFMLNIALRICFSSQNWPVLLEFK